MTNRPVESSVDAAITKKELSCKSSDAWGSSLQVRRAELVDQAFGELSLVDDSLLVVLTDTA